MKQIFTILFLLGIFASVNSFAQFTMKAEMRTRAEAINGYKYLPDSLTKEHFVVSQRTRLIANYKKENVEMHISFQDVRFWGDDNLASKAGIWGNTNSFGVYESWVKLKSGENHTFKIGRQELKYDDQRLFSWRNWSQYGLTYDAFLYKYKRNGWNADLLLSYNEDGSTAKNNSYYDGATTRRMKTLDFLYLNKTTEKLGASLYLIGTGYHDGSTEGVIYMTGTYGTHLSYTHKNLKVKGNYFGQFGKSFNGKDIAGANMFSLDAEVAVLKKKLILNAGFQQYSGADGSNTDSLYNTQVHTFDMMYGARYKYNGNMNMFTLMDGHTKNGGLNDIHFGAKYKFNKKSWLSADYHMFSNAQDVFMKLDANNERTYFDKDLGQEIDLIYNYSISKMVNVKAGFSYYMSTPTLETYKKINGSVGTPYWGWVMLTVKPALFTSK